VTQSPVETDASERPSRLRFAPTYNVAVAFIDRHIAEGRGAKVAIRTADSVITYAELADNVNRCAGGLLRLGLRRGERVLMVVKDCPVFFYLFWARLKPESCRFRSTRCCGKQTLPAGEQTCVVTIAVKQVEDLFNRVRLGIVEWGGLQFAPSV
jgi:hypothetical protein